MSVESNVKRQSARVFAVKGPAARFRATPSRCSRPVRASTTPTPDRTPARPMQARGRGRAPPERGGARAGSRGSRHRAPTGPTSPRRHRATPRGYPDGPLPGANLPGASYPSQPRTFTQETTFGNLAQLRRSRALSRSLDGAPDKPDCRTGGIVSRHGSGPRHRSDRRSVRERGPRTARRFARTSISTTYGSPPSSRRT